MAGRWLETDNLSNQNISSALAIGAYTADADRLVICDVFLDQVAGGGDYIVYMTKQLGGAGSHGIVGPKTTITAAAGETALAPQAMVVTVRTGDVLTVYVDGLAGDTTTPDTTVRWFELAALRPTTAGRTLNVSATGEAGLDFDNVKAATAPTTLTNITVPVVTTLTNMPAAAPSAATIAAEILVTPANKLATGAAGVVTPSGGTINSVVGTVDANLVSILGTAITETAGLIAAAFSKFFNKATPTGTVNSLPDAVAGAVNGLAIVGSEMDLVDAPNAMAIDAIQAGLSLLGSGAITFTYTLESSVDASPIADADVWVTTDSAGSNVIAVGRTNAAGQVVFYLDAGPVYVWRQKTGWTFANPDTEVVA